MRLRTFGNWEVLRKSQNSWGHSLVLILNYRNKFLAIAIKYYAKADIKDVLSYLVLPDFLTFW